MTARRFLLWSFVASVALILIGSPAQAAEPDDDVTFAWLLPDTFVHDPDVNPESLPWGENMHNLFPQQLLSTDGTLTGAPCGQWVQVDKYRNATPEDQARVAGLAAGGVLQIVRGQPTDAYLHVVSEHGPDGWQFVWTGDCAVTELPETGSDVSLAGVAVMVIIGGLLIIGGRKLAGAKDKEQGK